MVDSLYQVMPDLSADEYDELKASIAERGVMVPIEYDEDGNVLDGHHRLRACEELGLTEYPTVVREGMTEQEKLLHAFTLNTARRQLTNDQKATAITDLIRRDPTLSDRKIAKAVGASHPTVGKYRKQLEESGQVEKVTTRTGEDGKTYSVSDHDEYLRHKKTFTCCICGEEKPALYVRRIHGELVNSWGYDPWPAKTSGDCCETCNRALMDVRDRMPEETVNEHFFGPQWRELLDVAEIVSEKIGHDWDRQEEFEAEFDRLLAERGIYFDDKRKVYRAFENSTTKTQLRLHTGPYEIIPDNDEYAASIFKAIKSCNDVETLTVFTEEMKSITQEYAVLVGEIEKKERELRGEA